MTIAFMTTRIGQKAASTQFQKKLDELLFQESVSSVFARSPVGDNDQLIGTVRSVSRTAASDEDSFSFPSHKNLETKWSRWMKACVEYVEIRASAKRPPSLDEVQRYMLDEFGLSYPSTSLLLHDLAKVGRICLSNNRIAPNGNSIGNRRGQILSPRDG
jgi:hypothetical protein